MSISTVPLLQCIGCFSEACSGDCLPTHRDRFCCHNPRCIFHAPRPLPLEPRRPGAAQPTTPAADDAADGEETPAATAGDSNVVCRETITREWRPVGGGDGVPATTPGPASSVTANIAPAADAPSGAHADEPPISPARFTIEEYEAQARLLAQYQQPQGRQPPGGPQNDGLGGNGNGRRARTRTRVRFQLY